MTEFKKSRPLDEQVDAALAKYAAAEPRAGLEERILANLRVHERTTTRVPWWRWAGAIAVALLITVLLRWRLEHHAPPQIVNHPVIPQQQTRPEVTARDTPIRNVPPAIRIAPRRRRNHLLSAATLASAAPKLDQFPSPRPLTEQEKLLAEYVSQFQDEAVVVARARAEVLRQDLQEMNRGINSSSDDLERNK
jgi:hypothetical protein